MTVILREITDDNRDDVVALAVAPHQEQFISSVRESLGYAIEYPEAKPWYRAVYSGSTPVGFVMLSWDAVPDPPDIIGPWFLWKILIDREHQGRGYGAEVVAQVAAIIRAEGADELLTSYVPGDDGPAGFYERLGFVPTGAVDSEGEIIMRLTLV